MRPIPLLAVTLGLLTGTVLSAFVPSFGSASRAGTALRMNLEQVFDRSALVVEGRVRSGTTGRAANGVIYTDWEIDVARTFWGEDRTTRIIRIPGGVLPDGRGMIIPGLPRLMEGEDVVLLLGEASPAGLRMPTGLSQGKYRVSASTDGERTAIQTGEDVTLVNAERVRTVVGQQVLDHAELLARLEAAAQARSARGSAPARNERSDADTASDDR